jgi:hypothetical protein
MLEEQLYTASSLSLKQERERESNTQGVPRTVSIFTAQKTFEVLFLYVGVYLEICKVDACFS